MSIVRLLYDVTGSHHGQVDGLVVAYAGDEPVGQLDYSMFRGVPRIDMITVRQSWRRQGIATAMLDRLRLELGPLAARLDWGATTSDGTALRRAYQARTA